MIRISRYFVILCCVFTQFVQKVSQVRITGVLTTESCNFMINILTEVTDVNALYSKTSLADLKLQHEVNQGHFLKLEGFRVDKGHSSVVNGGTGVKVTKGYIPKSTVVAIYPGTLYRNNEPLFFQSIGNPFIFRCIDGLFIDGNNTGISKYLYRSCAQRDRFGPYLTCDMSWLTPYPVNPLAIGQFVNNHNKENPANIAYQEFDFPLDFDFHLMKYIPNVYFGSWPDGKRAIRTIVLISTRNIEEGEELFSTYFTVVH